MISLTRWNREWICEHSHMVILIELIQQDNMSNFSHYIDSVIAKPPADFKNVYGYQCKASADAISNHLGLDIQLGNAWDLYKHWVKGYHAEKVWSYIPLPWDLVFMAPTKQNAYGHIATVDEGCTLALYKVIHQNYWVQWASGSGQWDRRLKRQTIPAQRWAWILARDIPFLITK